MGVLPGALADSYRMTRPVRDHGTRGRTAGKATTSRPEASVVRADSLTLRPDGVDPHSDGGAPPRMARYDPCPLT